MQEPHDDSFSPERDWAIIQEENEQPATKKNNRHNNNEMGEGQEAKKKKGHQEKPTATFALTRVGESSNQTWKTTTPGAKLSW